jgi:hypothetical protein
MQYINSQFGDVQMLKYTEQTLLQVVISFTLPPHTCKAGGICVSAWKDKSIRVTLV